MNLEKQKTALFPTGNMWIAFVPYAVVSIIHVWARTMEHSIHPPTKLMLMPLLMLAVVLVAIGVKKLHVPTMIILLLGIFTSWLGDGSQTFFPMFEDELPMMLLNFGIAHLAYMWIFWKCPGIGQSEMLPNGRKRFLPLWTLIYVPAYIALVGIIAPRAGELAIPIAIYAIVLAGTAVLAARVSPIVAMGGFWFFLSDAILGIRIFMPDALPSWTSGLVMFTYTLGQGLIAYGVMRKAREFAAQR